MVPQPDHSAAGVFVISIGLVLLICILGLLFVRYAFAHGPASWIDEGKYKNAMGELCCGERDCIELAASDVKVTQAGYLIVSLGETVPFGEAAPSPYGGFWRCAWGGKRKCFFAPVGSS